MKKAVIALVALGIVGGAVYFFLPHTRTEYSADGSREAEGKLTWKEKPVGEWKYWWPNGRIREQGSWVIHPEYDVAYKTGAWRQWDSQGVLCGEADFGLRMMFNADPSRGRLGASFDSVPQKGYWSDFDSQGKVEMVVAHWPQERTASGAIIVGEYTMKWFPVTIENDLLASIAAAKQEVWKHTAN